MKRSFLLILTLLIFVKANSQTKTVTVISGDENKALSNVLIFNNSNIIAETNAYGKATIRLRNVDTIVFVKNGFHDAMLTRYQTNDTIKLIRNKAILLNEVKITPISPKILLTRVAEFLKGEGQSDMNGSRSSNYKIPHCLQIYNIFAANYDTLHYINDRFVFEGNRLKVNPQNKVVKRFKRVKNGENIYSSYTWRNQDINFDIINTETPLGVQYSVDFTNFFFHQDLFDYKIEEDEKYYKLSFRQKKKLFSNVEGYLVIDKYDYGIYEFQTKLKDDKPLFKNGSNFGGTKKLSFKIISDDYNFSCFKENGKYVLNNCTKNIKFSIIDSTFNGIIFSNKIQVEKTVNFVDANLKFFDSFTWDLK